MQTTFCPIKHAAQELGVEVYQPTKVRDGALKQWLLDKAPDVCVVFAYGRILPPDVLHSPPLGCINLHASLLPRYRGAAPIQWALVNGEKETGISLMQMDEGLDTGPVFTQRAIRIPERCTGGDLTRLIHDLAVDVVRRDLPMVTSGARPVAQDHSAASHAPPLEKHHLVLDFNTTALELDQRIRAFAPAPGAHCFIGNKRLKVLEALPFPAPSDAPNDPTETRTPGLVVAAKGDLCLVATKGGLLRITSAQAEGKRVMEARDLINGRVVQAGQLLRSTTD